MWKLATANLAEFVLGAAGHEARVGVRGPIRATLVLHYIVVVAASDMGITRPIAPAAGPLGAQHRVPSITRGKLVDVPSACRTTPRDATADDYIVAA